MLDVVSAELLENLCMALPAEAGLPTGSPVETKGYKSILKLPDWLAAHNISAKSEKPYHNGIIYLIEYCPFSSAHTDGAYAIQFASGAVHAGCHHASCGGGKQRWQELRELYETQEEKQERQEQRLNVGKRERARAKSAAEGIGMPPAGNKPGGASRTFLPAGTGNLKKPGPDTLPEYALTDAGNAEHLIAAYGDRARYCAAFNAWYLWNRKVWVRDDAGRHCPSGHARSPGTSRTCRDLSSRRARPLP